MPTLLLFLIILAISCVVGWISISLPILFGAYAETKEWLMIITQITFYFTVFFSAIYTLPFAIPYIFGVQP